jgi:shikimate dehydrogenase
VLLLGAGGAARGVVRPLLAERPRCLVIANRTAARALALANALQREVPEAEVRGTALAAAPRGYDVVINATSAGLGEQARVADLDPAAVAEAFCYDLTYASGPDPDTTFCRWAAAHGARRVADGLGMLVEQAALAFALWRGTVPATAPVLELLRARGV